MDNSTIKDFALAISRITRDSDGCYTWELFNSLYKSSAAPLEGVELLSFLASGKFRTNSEGRGVWRWSEYLCDWVQLENPFQFSLVCSPSEQVRRIVALHTA